MQISIALPVTGTFILLRLPPLVNHRLRSAPYSDTFTLPEARFNPATCTRTEGLPALQPVVASAGAEMTARPVAASSAALPATNGTDDLDMIF